MKRILIVNLGVIMIIALTTCISYSRDSCSAPKRVISERIEVLNQFYTGNIDMDDTMDMLAKIETGRIYKSDLKNLKKYERTDIDTIINFKVTIESYSKLKCGIVKGKAKVIYKMKSMDKTYYSKCRYYFTGEEKKNNIKLNKVKKL